MTPNEFIIYLGLITALPILIGFASRCKRYLLAFVLFIVMAQVSIDVMEYLFAQLRAVAAR